MKKFLVLYRSSISARDQMANATPEQAKAGMDAWMAWAKKNGRTIVDLGSPLGGAQRLKGDKTERGDDTIGGFSIVQGESMESVTKSLRDHPHTHMPGNSSIEVIEFLAMPGA